MEARRRRTYLLLTATVDIRGVGRIVRADPAERYEDYRWALGRWVRCPGFDGMVFAENSGYDVSGLRDTAVAGQLGEDAVEFLSFDGQDFPRHLGKGFGENLNIEHALANSKLLADDTAVIVRSNGRNYVENIQPFLAVLDGPVDVLCDLQQSLTWADGRVLGGTKAFFRDYACRFGRDVDDSHGHYYEHALARAIHAAMADGLVWSPFPEPPTIAGYSGTSNRPIADRKLKQLGRRAFHRVKVEMLRR